MGSGIRLRDSRPPGRISDRLPLQQVPRSRPPSSFFDPGRIRVITRFNLDEFAFGVSDVGALLGRGAEVRGIRNLHAKMYLFGETRAIVTSANLTDAGFDRNAELGIADDDPAAVANCMNYFESLCNRGRILRREESSDWVVKLAAHRASGGRTQIPPSLGDFGADIGLPLPPTGCVSVRSSSDDPCCPTAAEALNAAVNGCPERAPRGLRNRAGVPPNTVNAGTANFFI